jgi:hypothetical protein
MVVKAHLHVVPAVGGAHLKKVSNQADVVSGTVTEGIVEKVALTPVVDRFSRPIVVLKDRLVDQGCVGEDLLLVLTKSIVEFLVVPLHS